MNTRSCVLAMVLLSACADPPDASEPGRSTRNHLLWKRAHAVEQDLAQALALDPAEVCTELGDLPCVEKVHLASLGGHDPFDQGLYRGVERPLVTSPLVLERVAISACRRRAELDRGGTPEVFVDLDLDGDAPAAGSKAATATIVALYRRLLARDPNDTEIDTAAELAVDDDGTPLAAVTFATMACVAVATTTEFSFF